VILARGNFESQWIRKQMLSHGAKVQSIGGVEVYVAPDHGEGQSAFALPDIGIAVFGDLASVQQVIANRTNPSTLDPALQNLIDKTDGNDAWFASILPGSYLNRHLNGAMNHETKPQAQALESVRQAAGGVQFGDPIQFTFDAVTRSPQDAVSLSDFVRFMASFVQLQRQNDPHAEVLATALDNMTLNASGNTFHASLAIPEKSLEQLAESGMKPAAHHGFKSAKPSQQ
jgi:hypothetical protein